MSLKRKRIWFVVTATVLSTALSVLFGILVQMATMGLFLFPFFWLAIFLLGWYESITGESVGAFCKWVSDGIHKHEKFCRISTIILILVSCFIGPLAIGIWVKPLYGGIAFVIAVVIWLTYEFKHAGVEPEDPSVK